LSAASPQSVLIQQPRLGKGIIMASNPYNAPLQPQPAAAPASHVRMLHIKEIDPMSLGTLNAAFGACFGVIAGVIVLAISILGAAVGAGSFATAILTGVGVLVFSPAVYGLAGFIGGLISAVLYNFVAGLAGGVGIKVET
jgi:hypothetical protein